MFKGKIRLISFVLLFSIVNLLLYHIPFFKFIYKNSEPASVSGILLLISFVIIAIVLNAFMFYVGLYLLRTVGKWILVSFFMVNAVSVYFINTYSVIIDKSMIGNVLNTNYDEASSFFSFGLVLYLLFLGVLPSIFVLKIKHSSVKFKTFSTHVVLTLLFLLGLAYANSSNWLWIDKHSKRLGALVMPWSYVVNTSRYYIHKSQENAEEILLPDAKIKNNKKEVVVLVIGESARKANFSLYGYGRNTNPQLAQVPNLNVYEAKSAATYTTAGVKAILEHKDTGDLYEILPNYLHRNGVDVVWRTSNWGEPPVKIDKYQKEDDLKQWCEGDDCEYDEVLLAGLKEQIQNSPKDKILIVLHTSTSHGPTYYKKYPPKFNQFTPVCKSVELAKCSQEELISAYDNTILYTDYMLASLIDELKGLPEYSSSMLFVSDHGESLGENKLYMHGLPMSIAPEEQYEIPFLVWSSSDAVQFKKGEKLSQHHVFHSVLDLLSIESPVYNEEYSIVKAN